MQSSKITTSGLFLDDIQPSGIEQGTGWVIGDGVTLTAGHVVYEYNRSRTSPAILDGSNSVFLDFEGYQSLYGSAVSAHIANNTLPSSLINAKIESELISHDAVAISQGGSVDENNAGLAWFLNPTDLGSVGGILNSVTLTRYGNTTGNLQGSVTSVSGDGSFRFSAASDLGDSGGAYVVASSLTAKGFVFGSQVGQPALPNGLPDLSQNAYAAYLSGSDFNALMGALEGPQVNGDVTHSEPTNLIVGSGSGEAITGTYRADIILGRGGGDTLEDGDSASDRVYANDLLFGGGGDDTFVAGKGNDLLHGGASHDYTASGEADTLENDGSDQADYGQVINRGTSDKGLTIFIAPAGTSGVPVWTFGNTTDQSNAIYVVDNAAATSADYIGSDTLISVEKVSATGADDTLRLDVTAGNHAQFAGSDGTGGIATIDLKGNATGAGKGDLIDASHSNVNWKIDLSSTSNNVVDTNHPGDTVVTVLGAERVTTADGADQIIGNDQNNEFVGGKGNDTFTGGKGDDKIEGGDGDDTAIFSGNCSEYDFTVSGTGSARTVTVTHARGSMADGTDTLTGVEWAQMANGERIDLTVDKPGCKGQDLAFVIDTTGSMWDDFAYVQSAASSLIAALFDPVRGFDDSRIAVVGYNDPTTSVVLPFTDQENTADRESAALSAINSLSADGGGDTPELTYTGLLQALDGSIGEWREDATSRKIVVFGDAPAKDGGLAGEVYTLAANVNADISGTAAAAVQGLSLMTVNMAQTDAVTGETHVVPVQIYTVAIGYDWEAIAEFQQIAQNTGGIAFQAPSASDLVDALLAVINLPIYNIHVDLPSVVEGDDGAQYVTVTVTRDVADHAATVTLSQFGKADGADVTGLPGSITFDAGVRSAQFTLTVHGDTDVEPNETYGVSIASISENASYTNRSTSFTIVDDDLKAVLVQHQANLNAAADTHYPFLSYSGDAGDPVQVHQIPFKAIDNSAAGIPFAITALDSADSHASADIAVMTQHGIAVFDGDDPQGNGHDQGIDGDETLVISIKDGAAFDFATAAHITLSPTGDGPATGEALFFLGGVEVGSAVADGTGHIDAAFDGSTGFDTIEIVALGAGNFTVDSLQLSDLYSTELVI